MFDVKLVPNGTQAPVEDLDRPANPIGQARNVRRSATPGPDTGPVAPIIHNMRHISISHGSPTPDPPRGRQRRDLSPEVKMEDRKGKKRARFA